jgi:UPF0755 protein
MHERSDAERERARLEREARRAARARAQQAPAPASPDPPRDAPPPRPPAERARDRPPVKRPPLADRTDPPASPARERPHVRERVNAALARSARRSGVRSDGDGPARPPRRRLRFAAPFAIALLAAGLALAWFLSALYQPGHGDGGSRVAVAIPRGGSLDDIASRLDEAGVISSRFFFKLRARMSGHTSDLKPGRYALREDMAYAAVLDRLTAGVANRVVRVTIPEGRARSEIAPVVKNAGVPGDYERASAHSRNLSPRRYGAPRGATLEGFLFPSTYELKRGATVRTLVKKQLAAFKENFAKVGMSYAKRKNLTPFDVVTIASMVEREAQLDRERPLIAAVVYNRLKQGMPLGIDATIRYATGNWARPLRVSELHIGSGYNTREHQGLPPGPIGNPGLASLRAAAHPARVKYLFYVVKPGTCGRHSFSSTDAQFQKDVAKYNAARAKKGGKSPTTC